jgi:hypothetical protein
MLTLSLIAFAFIGFAFVLLAPVLVRLFKRSSLDEITGDWFANFSPANYDPMHRLLAREDFQFLARQPGFDLSLYRKLRRERMLIFRQYLSRLILDFNRLHTYLRFVAAHSDRDQSSLLTALVALRIRFAVSVMRAEVSYYLCMVGVGSLATQAVVAHLEELAAHCVALQSPNAA